MFKTNTGVGLTGKMDLEGKITFPVNPTPVWVLDRFCTRDIRARPDQTDALEEIRITMLRMWEGASLACATAGPHLYNIIYPKEGVTGPSPKWRLQVWAPGGAHGGPEMMLRGPVQ